jgi:hypothetical protein
MKRLLTSLCVLLCAQAMFGANPSYTAFLGTNGIIITSNPPQGRIIIDGRLITNGLIGGVVDPITNRYAPGNIFTNFAMLIQSGDMQMPGLTPNTMLELDIFGNVQGTIGRPLVNNFFAMGISNILAADGIALATNNGVLWITNTITGTGSGLTTNANQFLGVPLSIKDAALLTNTINFGAGFLGSVTNILTAPQFIGTNVVFDGSLSSWFQFNPRTGPETNYVFTNIQAGQTISVKTFVTNGTTVRIWANTTEIPASWYVGNNGSAANINSNSPSLVLVSRDSLVPSTNVTIQTRDFESVAGSGMTFTTNFPAGTVTFSSTGGGGGGDGLWTNEPAGRIHPVEFTNRVEIQRSFTIGTNSESFSGAPGTNDFIFGVRDITKDEDYSPKIEFAVTSNSVYSLIASILTRDKSAWRFAHVDEGGNTASAQIGADKPGGTIIVNSTNGIVSFAVVETNVFFNGISYYFPSLQGSAGTVLTNNGSGVLGWGTPGASVLNGTTNFINLSVQAAKVGATNYPAFNNGYDAWETTYYETNSEGFRATLGANWQFMVPPDYATNSLQLLINYSLITTNGPNTSNVIFGASVLVGRSGTTNNIRTNLFGFTAWGTNEWPGKYDGTNYVTNMVINLGTNAALQAADLSVLKVQRDAVNDTFGGAVSIHGLQLMYTRQ